jgi:hypothetical protein
MSSF